MAGEGSIPCAMGIRSRQAGAERGMCNRLSRPTGWPAGSCVAGKQSSSDQQRSCRAGLPGVRMAGNVQLALHAGERGHLQRRKGGEGNWLGGECEGGEDMGWRL